MRLAAHLGAWLTLSLTALGVGACSLAQPARSDCASDGECALAFGLGSRCETGFCTEAAACSTGHDCRRLYGGGACVEGRCTSIIPLHESCSLVFEPADALTRPAAGDGALRLVGGILPLEQASYAAMAAAARLAVREIATQGGLVDGEVLGLVFCDNGGPGNTLSGDARTAQTESVVDYLAGTLGVPFIVGPATSSDALAAVNRLLAADLPTVLISPSATSPALTQADDRLSASDPYGLFWRIPPSDALQGKVLAQDVVGADPTLARVAIAYLDETYGVGLATVYSDEHPATQTVGLFPFDDASDLTSLAADISAFAPDALVIVAVEAADALAVVEAALGAGVTVPLFFTDGAKESNVLLDPSLPADVRAALASARGTAPASPAGSTEFELFAAALEKELGLDASEYAFLAHTYDALYVGAYGLVAASTNGDDYDGRDVAAGLARLVAGTEIAVGPASWPGAKGALTQGQSVDVSALSGPLAFDVSTGEAPGPIEVWGISPGVDAFVTLEIVEP